MSGYAHRGPHVVMVGLPYQDGVIVYASDRLWEVSFQMESDPIYASNGYERFLVDEGPKTFRVQTVGGNLAAAIGRTYGEALRNLFDAWTPEQDRDQPGLPAATPELEEG